MGRPSVCSVRPEPASVAVEVAAASALACIDRTPSETPSPFIKLRTLASTAAEANMAKMPLDKLIM